MLEHHVGLRGNDHPRPMRQSREQSACFVQKILDAPRAAATRNVAGDLVALGLVHGPHFEHGIDEKPQTLLGRCASGRGVGCGDQAQLFEIGHDVAHRGRGQLHVEHF